MIIATYSADDDKLRLYPLLRLDKTAYEAVKTTGFRWAPRQEIFVAVWTPAREDFAMSICPEGIGADSLAPEDRAADRAERYADLAEKRQAEAEEAGSRARAIADCIPMGQPIMIGHHSEKRHRRDLARIDGLERKTARSYDTAEYWRDRAKKQAAYMGKIDDKGARHRKIKRLNSDIRRMASRVDDWGKRWHAHYQMQLLYETTILEAQGGIAADTFDIIPGGFVKWANDWYQVARVNRNAKITNSVTLGAGWKLSIEKVTDYRAPTPEEIAALKDAMKPPPFCNTDSPAAVRMTKREYGRTSSDYKGIRIAGEGKGRHRIRYIMRHGCYSPVFLTDVKAKPAPTA